MYGDDQQDERQNRIGFKSYLEQLKLRESEDADDDFNEELVESISFDSLLVENNENGDPVRHMTIGDSHLTMDEHTWDAIKDISVGDEFIICLTGDDGSLIDYHVTRNEDDYIVFKEYEATGKSGKIDFTSLANMFD